MATKFATQFMRGQWRIINADKILTEEEIHALVKSVEGYLVRPGAESVQSVITDYNNFTKYVSSGVAKKIFPSMWVQYLQSGKVGFLRYKSYSDTLPKGEATPPKAQPLTVVKPVSRPALPECCQKIAEEISNLLWLSAFIDVIKIVEDTKGLRSAAKKGKLRDPGAVASVLKLTKSSLGSLSPEAARWSDRHSVWHGMEDDHYYEKWWAEMAMTFRKFEK